MPPSGGYGAPPAGGFGVPAGGGYGAPPAGGFGVPAVGGYGTPPVGGHGAPQYEFSQLENETITKLAFWARVLSITMLINAGLALISCNVLTVAIMVVIAIPMLTAANAFKRVADTRGFDVFHMMEALRSLGTSFLVRIIIWLSVIVLVLFGILGMIFFIAAVAGSRGG
jgi:hypothetical protein